MTAAQIREQRLVLRLGSEALAVDEAVVSRHRVDGTSDDAW
jgi:hypothetical protein